MTYAEYIRMADLPARQAAIMPRMDGQYAAWAEMTKQLTSKLGTGCIIALYGDRGGGKTQIAVALCRARCRMEAETDKEDGGNPNIIPALYCRAAEFFMAIKATYKADATETEETVVARFAKPRLLIVDEAHERAETPWAASLLTLAIDKRYAAGNRDTIIIANCKTPGEFAALLGPSIASRAQEGGGFVDCSAWGSFRGAK
jgi:DNA replication protein DnaC